MKEQLLVIMIAMSIMTSIAFYIIIPVIEKKYYKQSFEAGIQYEKRMRQQAHDSIVANCIYNNGIPTTTIITNDSVLKENFPKPNMSKLLRGE